jgi:hypothetical protein
MTRMDAVKLKMPELEEGRVYQREDVLGYICVDGEGRSDYDLTNLHFPLKVGENHEQDPLSHLADERMLLQYRILPLVEFEGQLEGVEASFAENDSLRDKGAALPPLGFRPERDTDRTRRIIDKLLCGAVIYPVFIQKNDPQRRIIEGNHRALALKQLRWRQLPAFLVGYRNWF